MASPLMHESVWFDKYKYDDAEKNYQEHLWNIKEFQSEKEKEVSKSSLVTEIARARQHIKNSLQSGEAVNLVTPVEMPSDINNRVQNLETENKKLFNLYQDMQSLVKRLEARISLLENTPSTPIIPSAPPAVNSIEVDKQKKDKDEDDDDDIDLFGSDEEDDDAAKVHEQRIKDYASKKAQKKAVIAKSSVVLDVKPWDDETNMKEMEIKVREIRTDGLVWGASKLVPLAYGIYKLQIGCVVEDEKVSIDWLQETIETISDYVQSVDIAAFNKL